MVKKIKKYIGTYRVFHEIDINGKITKNEDATYLLGKSKSECYRYDKTKLAIYFPKGKSTANTVLPLFDKLGIKYTLYIEGDYELVYLVEESQIDKIHSILKFKTQGKNIKPNSVKTSRKVNKIQAIKNNI